jgi:hypothetical protein
MKHSPSTEVMLVSYFITLVFSLVTSVGLNIYHRLILKKKSPQLVPDSHQEVFIPGPLGFGNGGLAAGDGPTIRYSDLYLRRYTVFDRARDRARAAQETLETIGCDLFREESPKTTNWLERWRR